MKIEAMNTPEQPKPSRRYTCEICGAKCRTNNKKRGTRTKCPACERLCRKLEAFSRTDKRILVQMVNALGK